MSVASNWNHAESEVQISVAFDNLVDGQTLNISVHSTWPTASAPSTRGPT